MFYFNYDSDTLFPQISISNGRSERLKNTIFCRQYSTFGIFAFLSLTLLGTTWAPFWLPFGCHVGFILAPTWPSWLHLGALLAPSWRILGHLGAMLAPSWLQLGHLGGLLGHLGAILAPTWPSWPDLGSLLGNLRLPLGF